MNKEGRKGEKEGEREGGRKRGGEPDRLNRGTYQIPNFPRAVIQVVRTCLLFR